MNFREKILQLLRWLEKYTGTDMVYLAKGGIWWTGGRFLTSLCGLSILVAFGRFTSKEIFGAYQYILSMAAIFSIFSLPGIDTALIRTVAKGNEQMFFSCFKEKMKWGTIGSLLSLLVALWYFFQKNLQLAISFLIVAIFLPFINSFLLYFSFWQGKKRFDIQNKYFVLHNFLGAFLTIFSILVTKNLIWILLGYFFGFTLAEAIFFKLTTKKISDGKKENETIPFGRHLTVMGAVATVSAHIDKIIIWKLLGPASVAIFSFAERPVLRAQELIPISALALPKLSQKNIREIKKAVFKKFLKLFYLASFLVFLYLLFSPYFYKIFFPSYLDSIPYTQILSLILFFTPFSLLGASFLAEVRKKELYLLSFLVPTFKILLFFVLIPFFGIWGAVYSVIASQIFGGLLTLYFYKKL